MPTHLSVMRCMQNNQITCSGIREHTPECLFFLYISPLKTYIRNKKYITSRLRNRFFPPKHFTLGRFHYNRKQENNA